MEFLFNLEQIRIQVAKYFEIWSLYVYRVYPHAPSLTTPPTSPHNRVQNKHFKIFYRFRFLYLYTVRRVLKTHWDSRELDWTRLGQCEHLLTLESDWTGLDSTRLCWCVRALTCPLTELRSLCFLTKLEMKSSEDYYYAYCLLICCWSCFDSWKVQDIFCLLQNLQTDSGGLSAFCRKGNRIALFKV